MANGPWHYNATIRLRAECSASDWTAPDGSRPIGWMIIGMIKRIRQKIGCQGEQTDSEPWL
jgi:hypothetical protein